MSEPQLVVHLPAIPDWLKGNRVLLKSYDEVVKLSKSKKSVIDIFITNEANNGANLIPLIRKKSDHIFICVFSEEACENPAIRMKLFNELRVNMVSYDPESVLHALNLITKIFSHKGNYKCHRCNMKNLSEDSLWYHDSLYHANYPNLTNVSCQICTKHVRGPYAVHLHNKHGPIGRGEEFSGENHPPPNLYSFALVVCRHPVTKKYLVVQEFCNSGYWLPGGAVDAGEDIQIVSFKYFLLFCFLIPFRLLLERLKKKLELMLI